MNSAPALQEEKPSVSDISASSIEVSAVPKYRIPHAPLARFGYATTTEAIVFTPETGIYSTYFVTAPRIDISGFYEISITTPKTRVVYKKQKTIEALLGDRGKHVLQRVIGLIEDASQEQSWPLTHVEVTPIEDAEVENWQYILIVLVFDCDFEVADDYLHNFYYELDSLLDAVSSEEQDILQRELFFDVATTV